MKTSILRLFAGLLAVVVIPALVQAEVYTDEYMVQKQYLINGKSTCQAIRIHQNWFVTAAHCVKDCAEQGCQLKMLLAVGENITVSADLNASHVYIPPKYTEELAQEKPKSAVLIGWDMALLHFTSSTYNFESTDGVVVERAVFDKALKKDKNLRAQWKAAIEPVVRPLVLFSSEHITHLNDNLVVPRWDWGEMTYFSDPNYILYLGKRQAVWVSDGFGVEKGNSGGGVLLDSNGGIMGVVSVKKDNDLPPQVLEQFPEFAQTSDFFMFVGFSQKTTWKFVKETLRQFNDRVKTTKLKVEEPPEPVFSSATAPAL